MRYFELYSGIGGFRKAFEHVSKDLNVECKCVGFAELDPMARQIYSTMFEIGEEEYEISNIVQHRKVIETGEKIIQRIGSKSVPLSYGCFDMLVADVPCEKYGDDLLSKDTMLGNLLWMANTYAPSHVLIECPWNISTYDKSKSFQTIINGLQMLGYYCYFAQINSKDFGLPQDRRKTYIFGTIKKSPFSFSFGPSEILVQFGLNDRKQSVSKYSSIHDILEEDVKDLSMWITDQSKRWIFDEKINIYLNPEVALSIKPGMAKIQMANADNYYTRAFIETKGKNNEAVSLDKKYWKDIKDIRRLTHNECALLQGFDERFQDAFNKVYVPDTSMYKMLGNSTNVNLAYAALSYIINAYGLK